MPRNAGILFALYPSGIGTRLLWRILLFSIVATVIATGLQLYFEYARNFRMIELRLEEIEKSAANGIARSFYDLDIRQVQLQLEGILSLPDITAVKVQEIGATAARGQVIEVGQWSHKNHLRREIPLFANLHQPAQQTGVLVIEATLSNLYKQLEDRIALILITQGFQIFAVSLFILYVMRRLVTQHLAQLAKFVDVFDITKPLTKFHLQRRPPIKQDELDRMTHSFNAMCEALQDAYSTLENTNLVLEQDITARKAAEAEIQRLNTMLEQRVRQRTADLEAVNKELSAFSYSISHDLRGPLRRISGFAQLLMEEFSDLLDKKGAHYLKRIRDGISGLNDMIDGMLKLSHATHEALHCADVDLSRMAQQIIDAFKEQEPARKTSITIAPDVHVQGDPKLLLIALQNLLENAWKYTQGNDATSIEFGQTLGSEPHYFVRDNGTGFDPAFVDKLFKPFSRLHSDEKFEGSGIGLATVQRIIIRHGGRIWAESGSQVAPLNKAQQGATFYFTLWEGKV